MSRSFRFFVLLLPVSVFSTEYISAFNLNDAISKIPGANEAINKASANIPGGAGILKKIGVAQKQQKTKEPKAELPTETQQQEKTADVKVELPTESQQQEKTADVKVELPTESQQQGKTADVKVELPTETQQQEKTADVKVELPTESQQQGKKINLKAILSGGFDSIKKGDFNGAISGVKNAILPQVNAFASSVSGAAEVVAKTTEPQNNLELTQQSNPQDDDYGKEVMFEKTLIDSYFKENGKLKNGGYVFFDHIQLKTKESLEYLAKIISDSGAIGVGLDMRYNKITDVSHIFRNTMSNHELFSVIAFSNNPLGQKGCIDIANIMALFPSLNSVSLINCGVNDTGASELIKSAVRAANSYLFSLLDLSYNNGITSSFLKSLPQLTENLKITSTLEIVLHGTPSFSEEDKKEVLAKMNKNVVLVFDEQPTAATQAIAPQQASVIQPVAQETAPQQASQATAPQQAAVTQTAPQQPASQKASVIQPVVQETAPQQAPQQAPQATAPQQQAAATQVIAPQATTATQAIAPQQAAVTQPAPQQAAVTQPASQAIAPQQPVTQETASQKSHA